MGLWLTEGCPQAFKQHPAIWEEVRTWLASQLRICSKEITVVGSARFGFSLAPKTWGWPFTEKSDLDLAVVSSTLFSTVTETFHEWMNDYRLGNVSPRNDNERRFWEGNRAFGSKSIPHGFYDSDKLPTLHRYPVAKEIGNAMWLLKAKLDCTPESPKIKRASVRIYRDWMSLIARTSLNLKWV